MPNLDEIKARWEPSLQKTFNPKYIVILIMAIAT